jgi:S-adenosylmethionine synthetase
VCEEVPEVLAASVQLVSQIGRPIAEPWAVSVEVLPRARLTSALREAVRGVVARNLEGLRAS